MKISYSRSGSAFKVIVLIFLFFHIKYSCIGQDSSVVKLTQFKSSSGWVTNELEMDVFRDGHLHESQNEINYINSGVFNKETIETNIFDPFGRLSQQINETKQIVNYYYFKNRILFLYDSLNNIFKDSTQYWNGSQWMALGGTYRTERMLNSHKKDSVIIRYVLSNVYIPKEKRLYTYDFNDSISLIEYQYIDSGLWKPLYTDEFRYYHYPSGSMTVEVNHSYEYSDFTIKRIYDWQIQASNAT